MAMIKESCLDCSVASIPVIFEGKSLHPRTAERQWMLRKDDGGSPGPSDLMDHSVRGKQRWKSLAPSTYLSGLRSRMCQILRHTTRSMYD